MRAGRHTEPAIVTMGDDVAGVLRFVPSSADRYHAVDVVRTLLADCAVPPSAA